MGGRRDAELVDAAAHKVLAHRDDAQFGEFLIDLGITGLLVGIAVEFDLGIRGIAQEADEAVQRVHLVVADDGLVQVEEDIHVGALVDGLLVRFLLDRLFAVFLLGLFPFGLLIGRDDDRLRLLGPGAQVEFQTAQEDEMDIGTGCDIGILPRVEGLGMELGVELEIEGDAVAQADVRADTCAGVPEELRRLLEQREVLAGRGQVIRFSVLQADGRAHAEERIHGNRTVGPPAEETGAPVQDQVQVGLDELESV